MAGLEIADLNREVTTAAELSDDLLVEPTLLFLTVKSRSAPRAD